MTPADYRLYDLLTLAASAVDEAGKMHPRRARVLLNAARDAGAAYCAAGVPVEVRQALGLLLDVASPGRWRSEGESEILRNALGAHALAALVAVAGDRHATVQCNADAVLAAEAMPRLHAALGIIRNAICVLARAEAGTEAAS